MLSSIRTKTKKLLGFKESKNSKKVISVKCGLRQPKVIKSKVSNAAVGKRHLKTRNNTMAKIHNRKLASGKLRRRTSKIDVLSKKNIPSKKLNTCPRPKAQTKISDKENSFKTKTIIIYSNDINKSSSSTNPIFVSLDNPGENKRYKRKFRKLTSARKLKRLRENLWKKSSYHKRFLGKSGSVKSQKSERSKSKAAKSIKKRPSPKQQDNNSQKSEIKNSTNKNETTDKKNLEENKPQSKPANEVDLSLKKEESLNLEMLLLDSEKAMEDDVSMIDESFIKSLLSIANHGNKPENTELEHQRKDFCSKATKTDCKSKILGKEFFVNKLKNKKIQELNSKNAEGKSSLNSSARKSQRNPVKEKTDSAKSETEIKSRKIKTAETKNQDIKSKPKKAYSKHEINELQQKKKTRNIVKNKKVDNIEIPFPCGVLKVEEIQELWKRENSTKHRISRSSESSSTIPENSNRENIRDLGLESYEALKKIVAEEVYRISKKYKNNNLAKNEIENDAENRGQDTCKNRNAISNEKQISHYIRKKLAVKSKESFLHGEKQLQNAEALKCLNLSHRAKLQSIKSKFKLLEEKKSGVKKIPEEAIKNWSIVNRLEQAFLALGTPSFRKAKENEPAIANTKVVRTIPRFTAEVKRIKKKIKDGEKKELKPATRIAYNKPKINEVDQTNEKQLRVLHKKDSTTSDQKPGSTSSASSTQSSKMEDRPKSLEEKGGLQSQEENIRLELQEEKLRYHPQEEKVRLQLQEEKARLRPQTVAKPRLKLNNRFRSGIKPPTPVENLCSSWNKIMGYPQIGKVGKKNSPRNHLCETSTQNKNDDNLERKKTFQIISLKDSVIMQPRRSQSCNKIDRNSELDKKNSLLPTRKPECKSLTYLSEKKSRFPDSFKETEEMEIKEGLKNNGVETERPVSNLKDLGQISKRSDNNSGEDVKDASTSVPNKDRKCKQTPPQDISKRAGVTKDVSGSGKRRPIKERSILSIRRNQHENQSSRANISQIQEECTPIMFQEDTSDLSKTEDGKEAMKVNVFLHPIKANASESSCASLSIFDVEISRSSVKNSEEFLTSDHGLKLLKAPSMSPSKSTQIIASQTSTANRGKPKIISAPWERDINYYRALVKDIMSQHRRLDGFLKQGENVKALTEDFEELKSSDVLQEEISIQEYRKKIMMEYQEVPILEYKSKMEEMKKKVNGRWKRRNLLVIQPVNGEIDLDVKDYEPRMRTILGSRLYFEKENFRQSQQINRTLTGEKLSLQGLIVSNDTKVKNGSFAMSMRKSCLCFLDSRTPEEKYGDAEHNCLMSASNLNKV